MPGRPVSQTALFKNQDILFAHAGQLVGNRATDDSPSDDDDFSIL